MAAEVQQSQGQQVIERERRQFTLRALFLWVTLASVLFAAIAAGMIAPVGVFASLILLFDALFVVLLLFSVTVFGLREIRRGQPLTGVAALVSAALIVAFVVWLFVFSQ